jgi:hypothetical protein
MGIEHRKCKSNQRYPRSVAVADRLPLIPRDRAANPQRHLSWVEIELNVDLSFVPRFDTTAMIASEIPAAIRPYSIAVAADSSFRKRNK